MELTLTWYELLIAVILATVVYLLESLVFSRRGNSASTPSLPDKLEKELAGLRAEVDAMRQRLAVMDGKPVRDGAAETDNGHSPYDYAVQYARQGMIAPEIAARCGISRDEAALIIAMHRAGQEPDH